MQIALKLLVVAVGLGFWFLTQYLLGRRKSSAGEIYDWLHEFTAPVHAYLRRTPRAADFLLASSSFGIDCMGLFLIASAVLGDTLRPFLGMLVLFTLRQANQFVTALPPPKGVIWRSPGVPSLLVTYHVSEDMFFSGHTAIAVFAATELAQLGPWGLAFGAALAAYEIAVVLVLRAHWTMDIFTGAVTALLTAYIAPALATWVDPLLIRL